MQTIRSNRQDDNIEILYVQGDGALNSTLTAAAAVKVGERIVRLPIAADIFDANCLLYLEGTTNYDGLRKVHSVSAGYVNIIADYVAETFATTDTVKVAFPATAPMEILGLHIAMDAAPTTSENLTVTTDDSLHADFDIVHHSVDLAADAGTSYIWTPSTRRFVLKDDVLRIAWTNTDTVAYGLKLIMKKLTP